MTNFALTGVTYSLALPEDLTINANTGDILVYVDNKQFVINGTITVCYIVNDPLHCLSQEFTFSTHCDHQDSEIHQALTLNKNSFVYQEDGKRPNMRINKFYTLSNDCPITKYEIIELLPNTPFVGF